MHPKALETFPAQRCASSANVISNAGTSGDVLVYDGRTLHGVEEVDPNSVVNMNNINGRLVAMASLYKV